MNDGLTKLREYLMGEIAAFEVDPENDEFGRGYLEALTEIHRRACRYSVKKREYIAGMIGDDA